MPYECNEIVYLFRNKGSYLSASVEFTGEDSKRLLKNFLKKDAE
jgi:hypothetical protein